MTFGAMAAWQAWTLIAAAAGVAVCLFLLQVRPRRVLVPSLLLWGVVLNGARELTFWERIRRAVSLAATAAIAVALALALARPSRAAGATAIVRSAAPSIANVGITAFDVRSSPRVEAAGQAYLEVGNFGPAQQVHVTLSRGPASLLDRRVDLAAGEILRQTIRLDRGGEPAVRAHVDAPGNALALDDDAFAWFDRARPLSVTVVGNQTAWLARLFARDADVAATFATPAAYRARQEDVIIFDRWAPPEPPGRPALYIAPPPQGSWLTGGDASPSTAEPEVEQRPQWAAGGSHPVVRGVDPFTLAIGRAHAYRSAELVPIAASIRGTPLVYVNKVPARPRLVLVSFGPLESNLASAPAFPVLVGDALAWLARPVDGSVRRTGVASFDEAITRVTGPGGVGVPLARLPGEALGVLRVPGFYVAEGGGSSTTFAVNVADPAISNLAHSSAATDATTPGTAGGPPAWWLACGVGAFALLLGEWWTWLRRITV